MEEKNKNIVPKISFKSVEVQDLNGKDYSLDISKTVADLIYNKSSSVDMLEIARSINKGEEVILTDELESEINKNVVPNLLAFAVVGIQNKIKQAKSNGTV